MAYNKFITTDGLVLLDLTADTVTANKLPKGITAHDRSGTPIIGTAEATGSGLSITEPITITENGFYPVPKGQGVPEFGTDWKFKEKITPDDIETVITNYEPQGDPGDAQYTLYRSENLTIYIYVQDISILSNNTYSGMSYNIMYNPMTGNTEDYCIYQTADSQATKDLLVEMGAVNVPVFDDWFNGSGFITPPVISNVSETMGINPEYVAPLFAVEGGKALDGWGDITVNVAGGGTSAAIKPLTVTKNGVYEAKAGGVLEYDTEVKFKDVIIEADFEAYVANATPVTSPDDSITVYLISSPWCVIRVSNPDEPSVTVWMLMQEASDGVAYCINGSLMNPSIIDNCWISNATMTPVETPTMTIPSGAQMSADLTTTSVFFDLEKVDAYCPVTVDVAANVSPITITENGTYEPAEDTDGYSTITVNVPSKPEQPKSVYLTGNGTTEILPDDGYTLSRVTATVDLPLQRKKITITENGLTEVVGDNGRLLTEVDITTNVPSINMNGTTKSDDLSETASFTVNDGRLAIYGEGTIPASLGTKCSDIVADITEVDFDKRITAVEKNTFSNFKNIEKVNINDLAAWCNIDFGVGVAYGYDGNPGQNSAVRHSLNGVPITDLVIPEGVEEIKHDAFRTSTSVSHNSVTIPASVNKIGRLAFYNFKVANVYLTDLEKWCAMDCEDGLFTTATAFYLNGEKITNLIIPEGIKKIRPFAFDTGLFKSYTQPQYAGHYWSNVTIPDSVEEIGQYAFRQTGVKKLVLGTGIKTIGSSAFWYCNLLSEIHISDLSAFLKIDTSAGDTNLFNSGYSSTRPTLYLNGEAVYHLEIPNDVTTIHHSFFRGYHHLKSIDLGEHVTEIGAQAFRRCRTLNKIIVRCTPIKLGSEIFKGCGAVQTIDLHVPNDKAWYAPSGDSSMTPTISNPSVKNLIIRHDSVDGAAHYVPSQNASCNIYVPATLIDAYKADTNWSAYADRIFAIEDYPDICGA